MNPPTSLAAAAVSGPLSSSLAPPAPPPLSNTGFTFLQVFIQRHSGIVVGSDKRYLVEARLQPVLLRAGIASLDTLCARLAATPPPAALVQSVVDAMTTNETFFFRDPAVFEALRTAALPYLFAAIPASAARPLRIWSAASSTGQEPYSLAMLLHLSREEAANATLPPRPPVLRRLIPRLPALRSAVSHPAVSHPPVPSPPVPRPVEILGTDLSAAALARAREGRYRQFEVMRGLPAALLSRFFTRQPAAAVHTPTHGQGHTHASTHGVPHGTDWQIVPTLRDAVRFRQFDLRRDLAPLGCFDLILCRNVLLYFDGATRRQILANLRRALHPTGLLALGSTESDFDLTPHFRRHPLAGCTFFTPRK